MRNDQCEYKIKQYLMRYMDIAKELDAQKNRLEHLKSRMQGIGSPQITDMPKGSSSTTDRFADMLQKKDDIMAEIQQTETEAKEMLARIESSISKLPKYCERMVIRVRYIDGTDWERVNETMNETKDDFDDKLESYRSSCYRWHRDALRHMAESGDWDDI